MRPAAVISGTPSQSMQGVPTDSTSPFDSRSANTSGEASTGWPVRRTYSVIPPWSPPEPGRESNSSTK